MKRGMIVSHLWRTGKRTAAMALFGLMVALALPEASLAATHQAPSADHLSGPIDGVGDSPIMP